MFSTYARPSTSCGRCHKVIIDTKEAEVEVFKEMKATFQMSDLGLLSYQGIDVHQDSSSISLCQTTCAKRIVELGRLTGATQPTLPWRRG
jgi:hypothetical protein